MKSRRPKGAKSQGRLHRFGICTKFWGRVCQQEMALGEWTLVPLWRNLYVKLRSLVPSKKYLGSAMIRLSFIRIMLAAMNKRRSTRYVKELP